MTDVMKLGPGDIAACVRARVRFDDAQRDGRITLFDPQPAYVAQVNRLVKQSGVRLFRIGQRVKYQLIGPAERAQVRDLTIITL